MPLPSKRPHQSDHVRPGAPLTQQLPRLAFAAARRLVAAALAVRSVAPGRPVRGGGLLGRRPNQGPVRLLLLPPWQPPAGARRARARARPVRGWIAAAAAAAASAAAAPRADVSRQVSVDPLPRRLRQRVCKPGAAHRGALRGRLGGEVGQQRGAAGVVGGEGAFNIQEGPPCGGVVLGGAGLGIRGMRSGAPGQPGFCFPERICR
jgi:hypothetical protein